MRRDIECRRIVDHTSTEIKKEKTNSTSTTTRSHPILCDALTKNGAQLGGGWWAVGSIERDVKVLRSVDSTSVRRVDVESTSSIESHVEEEYKDQNETTG